MESKFDDLDTSFDDEELICEESGTAEENEFDFIVGALEEIVLGDDFSTLQNDFCNRHCDVFEDTEENKFVYTEIFEQFTSLIETTLNRRLEQRVPNFNMQRFEGLIADRKDEVSGEIFDLLTSLADFGEFKELMLSYKRAKSEYKTSGPFAIEGLHIIGSEPRK